MKILALYNLYVTRVVALLAAMCALSVFMYGAFLLMAVSHAADLRAIEDESSDIAAEVSELQGNYLAKTKSLTLAQATALGFVEPIAKTTVVAHEQGLTLLGVAH